MSSPPSPSNGNLNVPNTQKIAKRNRGIMTKFTDFVSAPFRRLKRRAPSPSNSASLVNEPNNPDNSPSTPQLTAAPREPSGPGTSIWTPESTAASSGPTASTLTPDSTPASSDPASTLAYKSTPPPQEASGPTTITPTSELPPVSVDPNDPIASITLEDIQGARKCGSGGFGAVLVLHHPTLGDIALKNLTISRSQEHGDLRRRTVREGDTWRRLKHPNVLPFLGVLDTKADLYLASPYVTNGSLDQFIRLHPTVNRRQLLIESASAVAYLHECGIVHGDIKASNILVSDDVHALLCDFGLARPESTNTSIGLEGVGTIRYQSPEVLVRGGGKTVESDVWAFGMTMYEVLSGCLPFYEHSNYVVINLIMTKNARPPLLPSHSPSGVSYARLWPVAERCWHKDAGVRPSMADVHQQLCHGQVVFKGHTARVSCLAFSPDGRTVASGSYDRTLRLWDVKSEGQRGKPLQAHTRAVWCLALSPDGTTLASGSYDETLRLWGVESGSQRPRTLEGHTDYVRCLAFSPDGVTLASGSHDHMGHTRDVNCLAFSPNNMTVVSGSDDRTLRLWDVRSGSQRGRTLEGHTDRVWCLAFSPDGKTVVSGSGDHTLRLWDVESVSQWGETLTGHTRDVNCLTFSPNGTTVVSGSGDNTLRLWDVKSGSQRGKTLEGHTQSVLCLAFSPDGKMVASGSGDNTIRLWDAESGSQIGKALEGHTGWVRCLAFSPDSTTVTSGSDDKTVRLWEVDY